MYIKNNNPSYEAFNLIQETALEEQKLYKSEQLKRTVNYWMDDKESYSLRKKEK
ncbi:MAG: hypothetical protein LKJ88_02885 [Bacilli bacterium]|jgi:hypothetical protein|nr:hypothetical protein [Bacilli bacterium]